MSSIVVDKIFELLRSTSKYDDLTIANMLRQMTNKPPIVLSLSERVDEKMRQKKGLLSHNVGAVTDMLFELMEHHDDIYDVANMLRLRFGKEALPNVIPSEFGPLKIPCSANAKQKACDAAVGCTFYKNKCMERSLVPIPWPDRNDPGFDAFILKLYEAFSLAGLNFEREQRWCEADAELYGGPPPDEPAVEQRMIPFYLAPNTPYHGVLCYHMVGSGKTRLALATLANFRLTNTRMIWVTTIRAKISLQAQYSDFPSFDPSLKDKQISPFFSGSGASTHPAGRIALFTYEEFVNALALSVNNYGRNVLRARQDEHHGDALYNTIVVIDEAHKIFEDKNGAGNGQYILEKAAYNSYATSGDTAACKWLFLTATPMPTIEVPTDARSRVKTAGGPQAAFRLLNMLIDKPEKRLPIDRSALANMPEWLKRELPREDFSSLTGAEYADLAKGLVSYFFPTWPRIFARAVGAENNVTIVKLTSPQEDYIKMKLNTTCKTARAKRNAVELARCYLRRLHWFGKYLGPRTSKTKTPLPGNLNASDLKDERNIPRALQLIAQIKEADAKDMQKYGKRFKHIVYSSSQQNAAAMYASMLVLNGGFDYMEPRERNEQVGVKFVESCGDEMAPSCTRAERVLKLKGELRPDNKDVLFFMKNELTKKQLEEMQTVFNDHQRNEHGQIARILVLGSGRKEAISLHDVKYVHIMEPQITDTDLKQIIGRARRYCSHVGLNPEEREIDVFIYNLELPENALHLRTEKERNILATLAYDAIKTDQSIGNELEARQKILTWMEASAFDIMLDGKNSNEIQEILKEMHRSMLEIDAYTGHHQAGIRFVSQLERKPPVPGSGLTVAQLKALCKEKGVKGYSKWKRNELVQNCAPPGEQPGEQPEAPPQPVERKRRAAITVPELKALCKEKGIKGYTKWKKDELQQKCNTPPAATPQPSLASPPAAPAAPQPSLASLASPAAAQA